MLKKHFLCVLNSIIMFFIIVSSLSVKIYADDNPSITISWPTDNKKYATGLEQTYNPTINIDKDYVQLEYIASTSASSSLTQYFDTGFNHDNNTSYEMVVVFDTQYSEYDTVFGAATMPRNISNSPEILLHRQPAGQIAINASNGHTFHSTITPNNVDKYKLSIKNKQLLNGDTTIASGGGDWGTVAYCNSTDYIYAFHVDSNISDQGHFKLYYFKIFDGDSLKRDFIPVLTLKKIDAAKVYDNESIPAGTPCLYDLKNNRFHKNKGSEEFAAGPALVNLNGNQYGVLDYIASTGNNYIDTKLLYSSNDIKVSIGFNQSDAKQKSVFAHFINSPYTTGITIHTQGGDTNGVIFYSTTSSSATFTPYYSTSTHNEFDIERIGSNIKGYKDLPSVSNDDIIATNSGDVLKTCSPFIFSQQYNGTPSPSNNSITSLYYLQVYDGLNTSNKYIIKRDYIPVKRMADGKIGLFDLVNKQFVYQDTGDDFVTSDHAPTGQNAIYHIVTNDFHNYSSKETDSGDYVAGVKLGNIGKALYASENVDLTHNWSIVINKFSPNFTAYKGIYDGNEHKLVLNNVKDKDGNIIDPSKYTIKYSIDNGANYDKDLDELNSNYNNFTDLGSYTVYYKIVSNTAGVYEDLLGTVSISIYKNAPNNSSKHYILPKTGIN